MVECDDMMLNHGGECTCLRSGRSVRASVSSVRYHWSAPPRFLPNYIILGPVFMSSVEDDHSNGFR